VLAALLTSLALAGGTQAGPRGVSVSVASGTVHAGDAVAVRIAGARPRERLRVYLRGSPRVGVLTLGEPLVPVGSAVADARGRARLAFHLPRLAADVYRPWVRVGRRLVGGRGVLSVAAPPPAGFGALGAPGCAPVSPSSGRDVFGTAAGAELWALPFVDVAAGSAATLVGVVGDESKIVFKMTSGVPRVFYAVSPDGTRFAPAWTSPHTSSNWNRPGAEWGAGFVFDRAGCWRIHAGVPPSSGDLWFSIVS